MMVHLMHVVSSKTKEVIENVNNLLIIGLTLKHENRFKKYAVS